MPIQEHVAEKTLEASMVHDNTDYYTVLQSHNHCRTDGPQIIARDVAEKRKYLTIEDVPSLSP
jgi:hypothetical protein